jgi:hypothetical protein
MKPASAPVKAVSKPVDQELEALGVQVIFLLYDPRPELKQRALDRILVAGPHTLRKLGLDLPTQARVIELVEAEWRKNPDPPETSLWGLGA